MIEVLQYIIVLTICFLVGWIARINCNYPEHTESEYKKENRIYEKEK